MLPSTKRAALTILALVTMTLPAHAQDRVIGLLTLPTILSWDVCKPFVPRAVTVFDRPKGTAIGTIEVDKIWTQQSNGGCLPLEVSVHQGQARRELPRREVGGPAEEAAIVLEVRDGWVKIRMGDGSAWVAPSTRQKFLPLATLFDEQTSLTALTDRFKGRLLREPGGPPFGTPLDDYHHVRVKEVRIVSGHYWLLVEALTHSPCDGNINVEPFAIAKGWLPAHNTNGEPTVWHFARGC